MFDLEPGWSLEPIGGTTGGAFMGVYAHEKFFLKRNASPFLAALSVEGITPKLIWTKRIATGDVLTAQDWVNGHTLTRAQMNSPMVAQLLGKVHNSVLLRRMLKKVGGSPQTPRQLFDQVASSLPASLRQHPLVQATITALQVMPGAAPMRVCHGDLNHKNWLLSDSQQLYLVDWDQASLGDIAFDLSVVLINYVPRPQWEDWLRAYGSSLTSDLLQRITWYGRLHLLHEVAAQYAAQRYTEMNQALTQLQQLSLAQ
ncbi:phosphotransferase family protein [Lacticaseibacillus camelliae]|uniref:phosphotransferase family protein n=1 Tax=Lacticaseibacillus camelliae TaxID=381742 RepID=UPI000704CD9A|nr:phosphotransferase family protein [Lacticaseibacillus camelliae]